MALEFLDPSMTPFALSFLFAFAIVFGLLSLVKHEKKDERGKVVQETLFFDKKVNAIIALVFGLFAATYEPFVTGLQTYLPPLTILLVVAFFVIFLKKVLGSEKKQKEDTLPLVVALAILLIVLSTLGDQVVGLLPGNLDPSVALGLAGLLFVVLIFVAVWKRPEG